MPFFRISISNRIFGCKWTMAISFIAYMPFIVSQLFPHAYTLIPSGLAVGFGERLSLHVSLSNSQIAFFD